MKLWKHRNLTKVDAVSWEITRSIAEKVVVYSLCLQKNIHSTF
jgi:hypothetical protein